MDPDGLIPRIALIPQLTSRYSAMDFFLERLQEAFVRSGVQSKIVSLENGFMDLVWQTKQMKADATLCFNGPNPDPTLGGMPSFTGVPHLAWLLDPPYFYTPMASDPNYGIACVDRSMLAYFEAHGSKNSFFLPHAVHKDIESGGSKRYEITLLSSVEDHRHRIRLWENEMDSTLVSWLLGMADRVLSEPLIPMVDHFSSFFECGIKDLSTTEFKGVSAIDLWEETRRYIRAKQRWEMLIRLAPRPIHVFGIGDSSWSDVLGKEMPHVVPHDGVSYSQSLKIQRESRVVLNSCPWFSTGSHDRIFSGLGSGAVVVTNENSYVEEALSGPGLVLYGHTDEQGWIDEIDRHLSDIQWSEDQVKQGRDQVLAHHTWDNRVKSLLYECSVAKKRFID